MQIHNDDRHLYVQEPDADFSPERNKKTVEASIRKYHAKREENINKHVEGIRERSEALAFYIQHLKQGKQTPVEKYFSRRTLAFLRGDEIRARLQNRPRILDKQGREIGKEFELL